MINIDTIKHAVEKGKFEQAWIHCQISILISPEDARLFYLAGNIKISLGATAEAVLFYKRSIFNDPLNFKTNFNLANTFSLMKKPERAKQHFIKSIVLNPNVAVLYNNLGNLFLEDGDITTAKSTFLKTVIVTIKSGFLASNLVKLMIQAPDLFSDRWIKFFKNHKILNDSASDSLLYLSLIWNFLENEISECAAKQKLLCRLLAENKLKFFSKQDQVFANVYNKFVASLLRHPTALTTDQYKPLFHIGESHCLSFAHHKISVSGQNYTVVPRIVFGAKAWHFAQPNCNKYKSLLEHQVKILPKETIVFLSFGEIDCRKNEGLAKQLKDNGSEASKIITSLALGYLTFVDKIFKRKQCELFILGVPAPMAFCDTGISNVFVSPNEQVIIIKLFNQALNTMSQRFGFGFIDLFSFTANKLGISNRRYHCDNFHLDPRAVKPIEEILTTNISPS